ncbi:MAG: DNA-binding response regulator [Citrobacter freundii]|nr:MAG: DNA-binding response regulator [Citrobacter freundii]
MPVKKVLIIDDEEAARILIRQYLEDHDQLEVVGECTDGLIAVNSINRLEPDLIFLDVQMPGLSGFQVIRQLVHIPQVIFTTAFDQYALKAFDSNAVDYLLKPYTKERFDQALAKALLRNLPMAPQLNVPTDTSTQPTAFNSHYERILLESGSKMISLSIHDIIYLEAEKDYTRVYSSAKNYLSNFGISTLEQRLPPSVFTRIHRSFIINIHYIKEVYKQNNDTYLVLKNDMTLKVSKGYVDNIRRMMY